MFFDEVASLSLEAQSLLLGFAQDKGEQSARIVAATRFTLSEMVERGEFNGDLLSALNGIVLRLPNLNPRFYENYSVENAGQGDFFALLRGKVKRNSRMPKIFLRKSIFGASLKPSVLTKLGRQKSWEYSGRIFRGFWENLTYENRI